MRIIEIGITALLLVCLLPMPYSYFQLVRIIACMGFSFMAFRENESQHTVKAWAFAICAVLFNPMIKIHLSRTSWNIVDALIALGLIILMIYEAIDMTKKSDNKNIL
jgi:lipoprotein signal peptidase